MKPVLNRVVALLLALLMCLSVAACAGGKEGSDNKQKQNIETITVTDMLGRKVDVPKDTKSTTVASTYGVVVPFLVTLHVGDRAKAVNFKNKKFYRLVNDPIINSGTIGTRVSVDSEALAKVDPDVYICRTTDKADIDLCARLGIPSIAITAELPEEVFEAYELLGKLLGCEERAKEVTDYLKNEERAKEVTDYLKNELKDIDALAKTIPEEDKVTALCMGSLLSRVASEDMLQTMLLKRVGAITVVDGALLGGLRRREDLRAEPGLHLRHELRGAELLDGRLLQRLRLGRHDSGQEQARLQNAVEARLLGHARTRLHFGDVLHDASNVPASLHRRDAAE